MIKNLNQTKKTKTNKLLLIIFQYMQQDWGGEKLPAHYNYNTINYYISLSGILAIPVTARDNNWQKHQYQNKITIVGVTPNRNNSFSQGQLFKCPANPGPCWHLCASSSECKHRRGQRWLAWASAPAHRREAVPCLAPCHVPQAPPVSRQAPSSPYVKLSSTEVFCFIFIWEGHARPLALNKIAEICKVYS